MEGDYIRFYTTHGVEDLKKAGSQYTGWCPFHADKGHGRPGFSVNPSSGLWYCHSCQKGGSVFSFCKEANIPMTEAPGYDPSFRRYTYTTGTKKKHTTDKTSVYWETPQGNDKAPYNPEALEEARANKKRLWICEGEKDTETLHSLGELAIGTPSATDLKGIERVNFREIETIVLAMDNDAAGKSATQSLRKIIPWAGVIKWPKGKTEGYDVTDCYNEASDKGTFLKTLEAYIETPEEQDLSDYIQEKIALYQTRDPNKPLGYPLTKFKALQRNIDGVQPGLYIVGADTSIGKTSFMANLFLDLIDTNKDLTGIYFSLDDNKEIILNRFLAITTNIPINKLQKKLINEDQQFQLSNEADFLSRLSKERRLFIYDQSEIQNATDLENSIQLNLRRKLFVVVDGLFNLDIEETTEGSLRAKNIERANALKRLVDVYRIPVICTAELRKNDKKDTKKPPVLDDIMETGKFKYNANLVLLLYPDNPEEYDTQESPTLNVKYAKNKLSHYRGTDKVTFNRLYSRIKEQDFSGGY